MAKDDKKGGKGKGKEAEKGQPADLAVTDLVEIEGQKYTDADIRRIIVERRRSIDSDLREVVKFLWAIYHRSLFQRWGFKSFDEYVEHDLGYSYRKANYLLGVHDWFTQHVTRKDVLEAVWNEIGWTKAKELRGVLTDDNADEWLEKARSMTSIQLGEAAKRYRELTAGGAGGGSHPSSGGSSQGKAGQGGHGDEDPVHSMAFRLTASQKDNVQSALGLAMKMSGSDKAGHNLDLIATNFISLNAESAARDALDFLAKVEKQYGIAILAVRRSDNVVVHGREVFEAVREDALREHAKKAQEGK